MTRCMFHMKRERKEIHSPAPLAGIEGAERGRAGCRAAVSAAKAAADLAEGVRTGRVKRAEAGCRRIAER